MTSLLVEIVVVIGAEAGIAAGVVVGAVAEDVAGKLKLDENGSITGGGRTMPVIGVLLLFPVLLWK